MGTWLGKKILVSDRQGLLTTIDGQQMPASEVIIGKNVNASIRKLAFEGKKKTEGVEVKIGKLQSTITRQHARRRPISYLDLKIQGLTSMRDHFDIGGILGVDTYLPWTQPREDCKFQLDTAKLGADAKRIEVEMISPTASVIS